MAERQTSSLKRLDVHLRTGIVNHPILGRAVREFFAHRCLVHNFFTVWCYLESRLHACTGNHVESLSA